jgi:hypothetical protein
MTRTRTSFAASDAARLMAVVVFPTPPFWLAMANTLLKRYILARMRGGVGTSARKGAKDRQGAKILKILLLFHVKPVSRETNCLPAPQEPLRAPWQAHRGAPDEADAGRWIFGPC